jgi:hypothetical protein
MCWDIEILSFYIPNLVIGDSTLLLYRKTIIEKILTLIEEIKITIGHDLFIKTVQGFFYDYETLNKLLASNELKVFITDNVNKIFSAFFYIIYGEQPTPETTRLLSEVENDNFEITKRILKNILYKYAQGYSVTSS